MDKWFVDRLEAARAQVRGVKLPALDDLCDYFIHAVRKRTGLPEEFEPVLEKLVALETHLYQAPTGDLWSLDQRGLMKHESWLRRQKRFIDDPDAQYARTTDAFVRIFSLLTPAKEYGPSPFQVELELTDPNRFIHSLYRIAGESQLQGCLHKLCETMHANFQHHDADGAERWGGHSPPSEEDAERFLRGTPFEGMLSVKVPFPFTDEIRFNHMHIVGGTGAGKTTFLETLILNDLKREDRPALVVVDSQGDLIRKISHLAMFERELADRIILISPKDVRHPPALNIFDINRERLSGYDEARKEQIVAGVISTFDYLFTGLLGADLTTKQGVFFKFVARLMLSLPETMGRNATILDMMHLMDNPAPYQSAIESLPYIQRTFFERDFQNKTFSQTKEQIRYRLQAIVENPTLERLFTSPTTKIDLFHELNSRSVILVDTAKDFLKGSSGHFGKIFISLVLQAVLERAALPASKRVPAFLYVDEAAEYFDSNVDDLLTEARKQKLGCIFAHQYLDQCAPELRASFAANTGIKCASGVSVGDARSLAAEMRTTPEFILSQPRLHFAAYVRSELPQAVSLPVTPGLMDREPMLSADAYERLLERNRARVVSERIETPTKTQAAPLSPPSDDVVSDEW